MLVVVMPEAANGKHKGKPKRRDSLAGLANTPPPSFSCQWNDEAARHDYVCAPGLPSTPAETTFWLTDRSDPFPIDESQPPPDERALLSPDGNYDPDGDGIADSDIVDTWEGRFALARPEVAESFACTGPPSPTFEDTANEWTCSFTWKRVTHQFTVAEIACIVHEPQVFLCDQWYLPCKAPCPPDETPPETAIASGPERRVASGRALFHFGASEDFSTFECLLDDGDWESCSSPTLYEELEEGAHDFFVRATDDVGNEDPTPAGHSWIVDLTAADTLIVSGPMRATRDRTPTFGFLATELDASFQCRMDGRRFGSCRTPHTFGPVADGRHIFAVRALDAVRNADDSPARRTLTVDTTGPKMRISRRAVSLSRRGRARVRVRCPASELSGPCRGRLVLKTASRHRVGSRRRIVGLGSARLRLGPGAGATVPVELPRRGRRLVARLGSVEVRATLRARDRLGNAASASRVFKVEAP